jgi:hypothetical protein
MIIKSFEDWLNEGVDFKDNFTKRESVIDSLFLLVSF